MAIVVGSDCEPRDAEISSRIFSVKIGRVSMKCWMDAVSWDCPKTLGKPEGSGVACFESALVMILVL